MLQYPVESLPTLAGKVSIDTEIPIFTFFFISKRRSELSMGILGLVMYSENSYRRRINRREEKNIYED